MSTFVEKVPHLLYVGKLKNEASGRTDMRVVQHESVRLKLKCFCNNTAHSSECQINYGLLKKINY